MSISISQRRLTQLTAMIQAGTSDGFYSWAEWREDVRPAVLRLDNWECQLCKAKGKHRPARIVHHVSHLTDRPDLALSIWDPETGARQLISVCKSCHEDQHPEAQRQNASARPPVTTERWD